ncbi:MAG: VWA domain-containing protein [Alphaproteobacteria bacterium]|nr:VWA domain-containing protein [Alphaproteobacteria bacterium]
MEWLQDFHFLRPYWLPVLVLPIIFGWRVLKNDSIQSSWAKICDEHLLNFLLIKGQNKQRKFPYILLTLISVLILLSLAGPTWVKKQNPALSVDNPVIIMVNMSTDMWAKDVSPSRIVRAEYVVTDLLKNFQSTETGLMVYSKEPFVISPLTEDTSLIENLLSQLDDDVLPENGDRLDRAIDLAVERMQKSGYEKGNMVILTADVGERFDAALASSASAGALGFDVNIIKVSGEKNEKLEMIADKGQGIYLDYQQNPQVLINKINNIYAKELKQSENMQTIWEDMGYYLFWLPALLMLYFFRKGVLISCLVLILGMQPAKAGWFLNNNQEAMKAFEKQNYTEAADKFDIASWKAAALYREGKFDKAYENFMKGSDNTSLYNQGNALAKSGKIAEAIEKYEQVLQQEPDFEDARFNLEYLKKMQQQQQNNQNQQQQQQSSEQKKQKQQQQSKPQNQQSEQPQQQNEQQKQEKQQQQNEQQQDEQQPNAQQNKQPQEGEDNKQQKQDSEQQNGEQPQNPDGNGNGPENSDENMPQQPNQKQAENKEDENADNEVEADKQSQYGNEDEQSEQLAKSLQTQAGAKSDDEKEKIKARLQKFRDVPEDKGGLLRALIKKEYQLNRYNEK